MKTILAATADIKAGGHYAPKKGDEKWKHKVADQMNNALCVCAEQADYEDRDAIRSLLERVSEFEKIPYHEAK